MVAVAAEDAVVIGLLSMVSMSQIQLGLLPIRNIPTLVKTDGALSINVAIT